MNAALPISAFFSLMLAVSSTQAAPLPLASSQPQFCVEVQRRLVDTALPMSNTLHRAKDDFTASKPSVSPLVTHQFVEANSAGVPQEISCKTKTADHLRSGHGASAARDPALPPRSCRDIQREIVLQVWQSMDGSQQSRVTYDPRSVMLAADTRSYTGSGWIGSPAEAWTSNDGKLHLRASALYAEWEDWRWKVMPKSFRGNHYCHLVAPERVRRLMLGEERLKPM